MPTTSGSVVAHTDIGSPSATADSARASTPPCAPANCVAGSAQVAVGTDAPVSPTTTNTVAPTTPLAASSSVAAIHAGEGFYPGDASEPGQMQLYKQVQQQYGVAAKYVVLMIDNRSDSAFEGSAWGHFIQAGAWKDYGPNKPTAVVSVPLAFGGFTPSATMSASNLQSVISGAHDGAYRYLADALVQGRYPQAIIRLGWEFDGDWMPWEATHNPGLYIAAFRHVHDLFASVSPSFRFDWTGAAGVTFDGTEAYPGDGYVDIIGEDIYDQGQNITTQLTSRQQFAVAHSKQVSFGEWGLTNKPGDDPGFIQAMYNWMAALPRSGGGSLAYQSYFLGNPGNDATAPHSLDSYPRSMSLYQQLFG
jgi:hypothetical protein